MRSVTWILERRSQRTVAALAAGQVDLLYRITISELDLVKRFPSMQLLTEPSAQTLVMRMQQDKKPFNDIRVRKAVVLCADREQSAFCLSQLRRTG